MLEGALEAVRAERDDLRTYPSVLVQDGGEERRCEVGCSGGLHAGCRASKYTYGERT
jgi:hypothetical protein